MENQPVRFDSLGLSPEILRALEKRGFAETTPIQAFAIPPMMEKKDVIAKAPTGTGKTFAFGIPILEQTDPEDLQVQTVIMAPTRELAMQINDELRALAEFMKGIRICCVYGGQPIDRQIQALKRKPQIVVATPGRLMDHMNRKTIRLDGVRTAILDEADRMLDMGFIKEVTKILDRMPNRKNMALFSATISREVMDISWIYQRDPVELTVEADLENKPDIRQYSLQVSGNAKVDALVRIMESQDIGRAIAFCNTKLMVERLTKLLSMRGYPAECIHGDIRQSLREKVMATFKKGNLRLLVATDVAARGIDVDDVDVVFNYDVPDENEYYIHRIGRTGRAKKHGVAYTFIANYAEAIRMAEIARFTKSELHPMKFAENGELIPAETGK
ncbi:DEAD/DEAH box helicase [Papillibacter cinnamivorans]|uniref:ATP-dependent RNA helicase DeaD n=1 Tax=Papillibacter cinnamivorans DSM 12816 TaxID=1122930 RepID=A0A1W2A529_9FIRM|nr:DEAD/DEAH box helicase [Papillibacter cinnamivorans]SMC55760.1 ATP-dependent RNA helicase DeaD [Papillibacter cinnamivorans DSM 12816]